MEMAKITYPAKILHFISGKEVSSSNFFPKVNPATGRIIAQVARGGRREADLALSSARKAFPSWSETSVIDRANILRKATILLDERKIEIAEIVHQETGKSVKDALAEVAGSIELGFFYASEGRRFYGKTTASNMDNRRAMTIRQPIGVALLIVPFNTPLANVAWKSYPALLCGNAVVLKAAGDTPYTAVWFAKILKEAGLPSGVLSVVQGRGEEIGKMLVEDSGIDLISFTGSVATGKYIAAKAADRLVKVSLELGGKNPLVVCDDADLDQSSDAAVVSAFSNAGQRCASASRLIVFQKIYKEFVSLLLDKTRKLKLGTADEDDLGPMINEKQLNHVERILDSAKKKGVRILTGGRRANGKGLEKGFYLMPTVIEDEMKSDLLQTELFAPVTSLYRVKDLKEAINLSNQSEFGLTSAIHTASLHRAEEFITRVQAGVVSVNGPTYGSEPHLPFGGLKSSGNGFREPGTEALDFYSDWKTVYIKHDPLHI